jgi:TonB family protein
MNIRSFTKSLIFLLVTCVFTHAQQSDPWSRYTVKGEEFSVLLPTLPAMTTTKAVRKSDQKPQLLRRLNTTVDGVNYSIEIFENPKPRQSLDDFIAEQKLSGEYDPASERRLVIYGVPGKEYSSANKNAPSVVQFFATEKRLYRFVASGRDVEGRAARDFFLSIKLGKDTFGIEVSDGPGLPLQLTAGEHILTGGDVDKKPRMLAHPPPSQAGLDSEASGTVILRVVFTRYGTVENIRVIQGLPGLTERAIAAAKQIKFIPAMKDGHPVSMWMQLEYNFAF